MPKKKDRKWDDGVRQTTSGRYEWRVMNGRKDDGSPNVVYGTEDTEIEARTAKDKAKTLPTTYSPHTTIAAWGDRWYADRKMYVKVTGEGADEINMREGRYLEESSYAGDGYTLAWIKTAFPTDELGYTTTERIETGIMSLLKPDGTRYGFGTYQKMRSMLDQMYNRAEVKQIITHEQNPMYLMKQLRDVSPKKKTTEAYDTVEVQTILDWVDRNDASMSDTQRRWAYATAVGVVAGYRPEEAVPLLATDIEPDGSAIQINKACKRGVGARPYKGGPKSGAGDRLIELPELVWKFAQWLRDHADKGHVFYSDKMYLQSVKKELKGNDFICWVIPATYSYNVKNVLAKVPGVRNLKAYEAQRHTGVTLENNAGIERRVAMSQSGHSDERVFKGYDHIHRSVKRNAAAKVNELLKSKPQEQT